jgi:hypothetical protein
MATFAVDALDDALEATKSFLLPVESRQWAKLALVVLFVGGGGGFNVPSGGGSPGGDVGSPSGAPPWEGLSPGTLEILLVAVLALVAVLVLFALAVFLAGPIVEYVLVECLRTRDVSLGPFWSEHWPAGLRLLAFRLGLLILAVAVFLPLVALGAVATEAILLLAIPLAAVMIPLFVLVNGFTTLFVVPITVVEDCGLIDGWRRLWPTLRNQPKETAAFVVGFALVSIALSILVTIVMALAIVALLVPFAILALLAYVAAGSTISVPVIVTLAILGFVFVVLYLAATALIQVPMVVYKRYYALLVLGDLSARFDLIPGLRGTIRAEEVEE